ncbi:hypothetical protein ABPG72_014009 [Tetrahymena utriculariae]
MPPKREKANNTASKSDTKKSGNANVNRKRKASEIEISTSKQGKANQSVFKILSSKMKGGKQTCPKHLQEKCSDSGCTDPHYTIMNVMEENPFKECIKKYNGCNDAMNKILGDSNQEAIILEITMRKVKKGELKQILTSPKDHLYYSMGIQGASSKQLLAIRNLKNQYQGNENLMKNFHSDGDGSKNELIDRIIEQITANHIFKCQFESSSRARDSMDVEVSDKLSKEDLLKIIDEKMNANNQLQLGEIRKMLAIREESSKDRGHQMGISTQLSQSQVLRNQQSLLGNELGQSQRINQTNSNFMSMPKTN